MANRIKTVSTYDGTQWGTEVPIGADASNVDVTLSNNTKTDLQTVLGSTPSGTNSSITDRINSKVSISGGDVASTVVGSNITNYDSSTDAGSDILTDTAATVNTNTSSLWSRFNLFRKKVSNNFNNYFATTNLVGADPGVSSTGDDNTAYTTAALNNYFSNVIGYESASAPEAGNVASQLDTLNRKTTWTYDGTDYTALTMYGVDALGRPKRLYPVIMDNGTNIWIGATATGGIHHTGAVHISTGIDDSSNPYSSIYVNIPNGQSSGSSSGSTGYQVLHRGNFFVETVSSTSGFSLNANSVTTERTLNCAKTGCTVLGIMNTWLTNQTNGQGVSYCFLYAQRQDNNTLKYYVRNYSASGNATGLLIHAQVLYLKTSF